MLARQKSLYSLYGKMLRQNKPSEEIQDLLATRLITEHRAGRTQAQVLRFAPRLVTRENVDTPEIQQILNMDWRPAQ